MSSLHSVAQDLLCKERIYFFNGCFSFLAHWLSLSSEEYLVIEQDSS